jgi:D-alanine-D-alanine ligase
MPDIDPDWWKKIFDETYLITDARSVCDENLTYREVDLIEEILGLDKEHSILDLCGGQGRHSLELSRRGYQDVTVLDYSKVLIDKGKSTARQQGLNTRFIQNDARETGLAEQSYQIVLIMASSLGYFLEETENTKILRECFRLLRPQGSLLLDLPNKEHVKNNLLPQSWHEADQDLICCRERVLKNDIVYSRELVLSRKQGFIRDETYCTRLYSPEKISSMLRDTGFSSIEIKTDMINREQNGNYGCMTNRMFVIAKKA